MLWWIKLQKVFWVEIEPSTVQRSMAHQGLPQIHYSRLFNFLCWVQAPKAPPSRNAAVMAKEPAVFVCKAPPLGQRALAPSQSTLEGGRTNVRPVPGHAPLPLGAAQPTGLRPGPKKRRAQAAGACPCQVCGLVFFKKDAREFGCLKKSIALAPQLEKNGN